MRSTMAPVIIKLTLFPVFVFFPSLSLMMHIDITANCVSADSVVNTSGLISSGLVGKETAKGRSGDVF